MRRASQAVGRFAKQEGLACSVTRCSSAGSGTAAPRGTPPHLGSTARLHQNTAQQQQLQQQQQVLQQHVPHRPAGDPVSMNRGTLLLGGMALLAGGVALGTQADRFAREAHLSSVSSNQAAAASGLVGPASGDVSGNAARSTSAAAQPQLWQQWGRVSDFLPPFLSHSHAQAHPGSAAAVEPRGSGGAGDAGTPLGGCLSPHFISDAAAKAAPAVVNIMVQASSPLMVGSSGSGFIVDADGTILTNAHVVADAIHPDQFGRGNGGGNGSKSSGGGNGSSGGGSPAGGSKGIHVTLQDGRIYDGRLVSHDTVSDLAVLKIEADAPLPTAKLGRSTSLRVGEWVVALGSPLHLQNSVTAGIVSCVDRKAVELGLAGARTDFIQTDAAINKGNSGGPLVNVLGEVIGISAMKAVAADGVSFAIPMDTAVDVMRQLKQYGRVRRPYLGIKMLQLNPHNAAQFRQRNPNFPAVSGGILVPGIHPGSPAERAGLRAGDCIVGFDDRPHDVTTTSLIKALGEHIGKPLTLRVARPGGVLESLTVTALEVSSDFSR